MGKKFIVSKGKSITSKTMTDMQNTSKNFFALEDETSLVRVTQNFLIIDSYS